MFALFGGDVGGDVWRLEVMFVSVMSALFRGDVGGNVCVVWR